MSIFEETVPILQGRKKLFLYSTSSTMASFSGWLEGGCCSCREPLWAVSFLGRSQKGSNMGHWRAVLSQAYFGTDTQVVWPVHRGTHCCILSCFVASESRTCLGHFRVLAGCLQLVIQRPDSFPMSGSQCWFPRQVIQGLVISSARAVSTLWQISKGWTARYVVENSREHNSCVKRCADVNFDASVCGSLEPFWYRFFTSLAFY